MDYKDAVAAWYASTHNKRESMSKKDKTVLKWIAGIFGFVLFLNVIILILWAL